MGKHAGFEIGPLTWVKGEIDSAMHRGLEALRAAAANPEDALQVKAAQAHLHQARGALAMVGLDGVTRIAEQLEGLLAELAADASRRSAERFAAAEHGFEGITSYLNLLVSGAPDIALALFGLYRELLSARERGEADPVDLYFPRLSPQPPHREKTPLLLHSEQVGPYLREQSARFQRGFLRYLRSDAAGVEEMRAAVEAIEVTQGKTPQRPFWWVALAFCDALATSALPGDVDPRRFCKRIEEQIRRIAEGSQNVAERLMREALYFVARSRPQTDRLREVQELYQLARTLPAVESPRSSAASEPAAAASGQPLVTRIAAEIQANLRAIEQVLDAYFRDSRRRSELAPLAGPLQQVLGAFEMLGELRARDALAGCARLIRRLGEPDLAARSEDFESIAQTLSGLGFYVEGLLLGEADFDAAMRPIAAAKPRQGLSADRTAASVETALDEVRKGAQNLYEKWKRKPTDTLIKAELQRSLAAIRDDAGLVADAGLQSQAGAALEALQDEHATALAPEVARALEPIAPAAPAPSPEAARLIDASIENVDAELLAVYLEEADEVTATMRQNLDLLNAQSRDREALNVIRRSFHTLKGSGRMVGLVRLGEAAWAVEQVGNLWLAEERAATAELLALFGEALDYFGESVARLKSGGTPSDESELIAMADALRSGKLSLATVKETVSAPAPAGAPQEEAPPGNLVQLGAQQISATLFAVFSGEARRHLATIRQEHETLAQHGVVTDELLRAAHAMARMAGTVKIEALSDLAQALENALNQLAAAALSEEEEALVGLAIEHLGNMVDAAIELRPPMPMSDLVRRLGRVAPAADSVSEEAAALARDEHSPGGADQQPSAERRQRRLDDDPDPNLLPAFLEEAHDLVPAVGAAIRDWRAHADRQALGQALQRSLHTLKGSARMVGAMSLGELAHGMETRIEQALSQGAPPATFFEELENSCDRINRLHEQLQQSGARGAPGAPAAGEAPFQSVLRVRAEAIDRLVAQAGEVSIARARIEAQIRSVTAAMRELTDNVARLRGQLREIEIQAETQMQSRLKEVHDAQHAFDPLELDRFTRFQELTRLMAESVGDVQTVHQNLIQAVGEAEGALAAQARLTREFSHELMRLRMVPFSNLAERLHRVVRQAAKDSAKRANLDLRGAGVELDRTLLERMVGPIEHLLRNAVTHGIEAPEVRSRKGKPEIGDIRLEVAQEANEVRLALADDGGGLDIAAIRARAASMGLIGEHATLTDAETADFIYLPGVTTAAQLTQAAGRGIGMDVVKNEVAMLGGRIDLAFTKDKGTRFSIFLPLTLAAINAVLVKACGQTYAIPSVMVEQVLQFKPEKIAEATRSRQAEWQSRRLDFRTLSQLLGFAEAGAGQRRLAPVLLLRSGADALALHVDEMAGGNHEIVVKATGPQLARIPGITGATVLGTGEIVLILNPVRLAQRQAAAAPPAARAPEPARSAPTVMVVDDSLTVRKITGRLLERQGYRVLAARDGVEATEMLQENLPEVMLVDIEMPRMDGFELTRKLRAEPRTAKIPVIMITSRAAERHQNHAMEIGANAYLGKPFQEEMLLAHIAGFVGTK